MATAAVTDSSSSPTVFSSCLSLSRLLRGAGVGDPPARSSARHRRCAGRASAPLSLVSCFLPLSSSPCVFPPVLLSAPSVPSSRTQAPQQTHTPRDDTEQGEEDRRERRRSERARDRGHAWSSAAAQRQRSNPRSPEPGRSGRGPSERPRSGHALLQASRGPCDASVAAPQLERLAVQLSPRASRGTVGQRNLARARGSTATHTHTHKRTNAQRSACQRPPKRSRRGRRKGITYRLYR